MEREKKNNINTYMLMSTLLKKKERKKKQSSSEWESNRTEGGSSNAGTAASIRADDARREASRITGVVRNKVEERCGGCRGDGKEEISRRRSQRRSRVVVQFGASVLPQWLLCGVWQ